MCDRNIRFWRDYWESLFAGIEHDRSTLNMITPRVVLSELIEEAETWQLRNKDNREFLFRQIDDLCKYDSPTKLTLLPVLTVLRRQFGNPVLPVLIQLARKAIEQLNTRAYFNSAVDKLCEVLFSEEKVQRKDLTRLCQDIIVELSECGFSREYIRELPKHLFDDARRNEKGVRTRFPHVIDRPANPAADSEREAYSKRVVEFVQSLSPSDRINHLKKLIQQPPKKMLVILHVKGLKGQEQFHIGDIEFYSPEKKQLISNAGELSLDSKYEMFDADKHVYMNACVPVEAVDPVAGVSQAREKLIRAIDILRLSFSSKSHYEIHQNHLTLDPEGRLLATHSALPRRTGVLHWLNSLKVDKRRVEEIGSSDIIADLASMGVKGTAHGLGRKIVRSLHWYRKGAEAETDVDRLLSYWILIENLVNPGSRALASGVLTGKGKETSTEIAFELLPRLAATANAYDRGWHVRNVLESLSTVRDVPHQLRKKAGLAAEVGDTVHLADFVAAIPELKPLFADSLLEEQLTETEKFYAESAYAKNLLSSDRERFRNEVILLYRVRNNIVHGAKYNDSMAPFFVSSAQRFCGLLIMKSATQYRQNPSHTHAQVLAALLSEYDILLVQLGETSPKDVLFK